MSSENNPPPFNPSRFAMPSTGAEEFGTRKIRSVIPVNKPGKMEWVHLFDHPDFLIPGAALLDLQDGGRVYLVVPEIAAQLDDDVRLFTLAPALTRQDKLFLWPCPIIRPGETPNQWHVTHIAAFDAAKSGWIRMKSNRACGFYDIIEPEKIMPEPDWPDMSAYGMGQKASLHVLEAEELLQRHKDVYHTFWKWADQNVNAGLAGVELHTVFGWKIRAGKGPDVKQNTFLNWPMQANGAEMPRLACIALEEAGIGICAPVHDAVLIEAPLGGIVTHVAQATSIMQKASEWVLGRGRQCRVDAEIVRWPDCYIDGRGAKMWSFIQAYLGEEAA